MTQVAWINCGSIARSLPVYPVSHAIVALVDLMRQSIYLPIYFLDAFLFSQTCQKCD